MYFLSTCVVFVYGDFVWYYHDFLPDTTVVPPRMNRLIALCFPGQHLISKSMAMRTVIISIISVNVIII